jgi:hypothetical protein
LDTFQIQLKEDVPAYLLKVKTVCPHFRWRWIEIVERPILVSQEEPSSDKSKAFNLIMHKVWRLKAFSSEMRDIVAPFCPATSQTRISDDHSFEAMLANTQGTWLILTDGRPMDFGRRDRCILAWVAPWAVTCSSRCAYYQLDGSFHVSNLYVYSIPLAIENNESFPLGFCIAPSKSIELYSTSFDLMVRVRA